jgi:uncharacterized protein
VKVRIHEIQDHGSMAVEGEIPASSLPLETPDRPALVGPVRVALTADADKKEVHAWGTARGRVSMACARCLARFETDLEGAVDMSVPVSETFLVVDDEVRQSLLLALPSQPLCRPACRGLCPRCGRNLNQGPCGCPAEPAPSPFDELKKLIQ